MSPSSESPTRRSTLGGVLVALGVLLLIAPSVAPVQPVLYHETGAGTSENGTMLEEQGFTIVEYEELSPRAQELYREALHNGGRHRIPLGEGAAEFPYPTEAELAEYEDYRQREIDSSVVIERPEDANLPPADEPVGAAERRVTDAVRDERARTNEPTKTPSEADVRRLRRQIARYDVITTRQGEPPLGGSRHLLRMASLLAGVLAVGIGGYLLSTRA